MFLDIITIIISVIALFTAAITAIIENRNHRVDVYTEISREFAEMWFEMDGLFIDSPGLHQYFYPTEEGKPCCSMPEEGTRDYYQAICIAEKFRDIFQYSEHLAVQLFDNGNKEDAYSYYMYMKRISACPIYAEMERLNPVEINTVRPIGKTLEEKLKNYRPKEK